MYNDAPRRRCFADVRIAVSRLPHGPRRDGLLRATRIASSALPDYRYGDPPDVYRLDHLWNDAVASAIVEDSVAIDVLTIARRVWDDAFAMPPDEGEDTRDVTLPADLAAAGFSPCAVEWARVLLKGESKSTEAQWALRAELRSKLPIVALGEVYWPQEYVELDARIRVAF
jgi:hypothetical protein